MKKFISILLTLVMIFSFTSIAFAKDSSVTPVIVVRGMGENLYLENEDGSRKQVFAPDTQEIVQAAAQFVPALITAAAVDDYSSLSSSMTKLKELFLPIACDDKGTPINNITVDYSPENLTHYQDKLGSEWKIAYSMADAVGAENTYFFTYVWTRSPIEIAKDLNAYIKNVKAETGSDKVTLVACSMGGTITMSYLEMYGTDSIDNVVLASTAFLGTDIVGKLFSKDVDISLGDALDYFGAFFGHDVIQNVFQIVKLYLEEARVTDEADEFLAKLTSNLLEALYSDVFMDTFVTMPGMWCLVPEKYYDDCKKALYPDGNVPTFIKTDVDYYMNNVQTHAADIIYDAEAAGVNFYITASYRCPGVPVYSDNEKYSDNLIDLEYAAGYPTVAEYGKKVGAVDDSLKVCKNENHNHVSPDGAADASTCILPEQTWILRNIGHMRYEYGKDTCALLVWLATSDEKVSVHTNEKYPQFVDVNEVTGNFDPVTDNIVTTENSLYDIIVMLVKNIIKYIVNYIKNLNAAV